MLPIWPFPNLFNINTSVNENLIVLHLKLRNIVERPSVHLYLTLLCQD